MTQSARPEASRPRIRLRFTALFATTLLVVLLAAAALARQAVRSTLNGEFEASVRSSASMVTRFFRTEVAEYRSTEATLAHIMGELVFEDREIRMIRPDGSLFRTPTPPRAERALRGPVETMRFPLDAALAPGWQVEIDTGLANLHALQHAIDRWFAIGIPLFVLAAAVAGWWLTGRTLRPVGAMADAAARIAPASGARLPIDNPDDELGRLGARFNALLDRVDGALTQQRQFLADAAHELRTPIARLRARVEMAQLESATAAVPAGLDEELRSLSQHVEQLLQLARADAAGDEAIVERQPCYLDDLAADALPRWQPQATRLGVSLTVDTLEESAVVGDPLLLGRLIDVLVDNALRYTPAGGAVRLAVRRDGALARLEVDDSGLGVPLAERARIFDRFYRGAAARARRADGSGLGLAIASWITERHGGRIRVSDSVLGGAQFVVDLPVTPP